MTLPQDDLELPVERPIKREPTHPGVLFREILDDHVELSVAEAAIRMGVTRQSLYAVLSGESAVTPDMALRFGRLVGGDPSLYLAMQQQRDLWLAERRLGDALKAIEPKKLSTRVKLVTSVAVIALFGATAGAPLYSPPPAICALTDFCAPPLGDLPHVPDTDHTGGTAWSNATLASGSTASSVSITPGTRLFMGMSRV